MESLILNRRARKDYTVIETLEAGIVLSGQEVKSVRLKRADLHESFVRILNGEAFLVNAVIQQYDFTPGKTYTPTRSRKLLLHKKQVRQLQEFLETRGLTAVPLMMGIDKHFIKVLVGIVKGKKQYEHKEELKRRDIDRETKAVMKKLR